MLIVLPAPGKPQSSPNASQSATQQLSVEYADGMITVNARNAVTGDILDELVKKSGLRIESDIDLPERVSVDIDRQPLPDALRLILRGQSFALRHSSPRSKVADTPAWRTGTLWILNEDATAGQRRREYARPAPVEAGVGADIGAHQAALNDPDEEVRMQAVLELAEIGGDEVVHPLSFALNDSSEEVRIEAVTALAGVGTDQAAAVLAAALLDEQSEVRESAVWALAEIGGGTSIRLLEETLNGADRVLKEAAIDGLAEIGGDDSARALAVALNDEDTSLREGALDALGEIGSESAIRLLEQALADGDPEIRSAAADILEELSASETVAQ